jgi:hypothetical protein
MYAELRGKSAEELFAYFTSRSRRILLRPADEIAALDRPLRILVLECAMGVESKFDATRGELHNFYDEIDATGKHVGGDRTDTGDAVVKMIPRLVESGADMLILRNWATAECDLVKDKNASAGPEFIKDVGGKKILPLLQKCTMGYFDELIKRETKDHASGKKALVFVAHGYGSLDWYHGGATNARPVAYDEEVRMVTLNRSGNSVATVSVGHFSRYMTTEKVQQIAQQASLSFGSGGSGGQGVLSFGSQ